MSVEMKEESTVTIRGRLEISAEVYAELTTNLKSALADAKALRQGIPCWLSAPTIVAGSLEKHLARIQGALGSIEVVREAAAEVTL